MAVRRKTSDSDQQLDLFSSTQPTYDTTNPIWPNGQEALARIPSENGSRLEAKGLLHQMLLEAEEKTKDEMADLRMEFMKQGLTPQQAHDRAWEMIRESYILLPPES